MSNGYHYTQQESAASIGSNTSQQFGGYGYVDHRNVHPYYMNMNSMYPYAAQQATAMSVATMPPQVPSGSFVTPSGGNIVTMPATEESYVENILRLNRGKMATFYMTYENNREWNAKIFKGVIEAAGRDHIVISNPSTGMRVLLLMLNLDYVTFDEPINYEYPFHGTVVTPSTPLGAT